MHDTFQASMTDETPKPAFEGDSPIIVFDVGGQILKTLSSTIPDGSMLKNLIDSDLSLRTEQGHLFLDRDPDSVAMLFNILRTKRAFADNRSDLRRVFVEADYFAMDEAKSIIEAHVYTENWPDAAEILAKPTIVTNVHQQVPKQIIFVAVDSSINLSRDTWKDRDLIGVEPLTFRMQFPYDSVAGQNPGLVDPHPIYSLSGKFCVIDSFGNNLPGLTATYDKFGNLHAWKFYGTDLGSYSRPDTVQYRNVYFLLPNEKAKRHSVRDSLFIEKTILENWPYYWAKARWFSSYVITSQSVIVKKSQS